MAAGQPPAGAGQPPPQSGTINRNFFFLQIRKILFPSGTLQQSQVDGLNAILDEWETHYAHQDDRWLAYALATTHWEDDQKFQPISEYGHGQGHQYGIPDPVTGQTYYGRGFVQLTWKSNYQKMGNLLGIDLVNTPDLALELGIATKILFVGMTQGIFTGRKLGDYFNNTTDDWYNARMIINGHDHANDIAGFGHDYYAAISYTK